MASGSKVETGVIGGALKGAHANSSRSAPPGGELAICVRPGGSNNDRASNLR
jgi:hypothetical protein